MKQMNETDLRIRWARSRVQLILVALLFISVLFSACDTLDKPVSSPYYAEVVTPPVKKEFRWSNGKLPRSFDPAMAAAPPESDIVRAIYEGLTLTDPKTLEAVPAVADKWYTPDNGLTWKFGIRKDAVWSNGKPVHADDFIRSWNRLLSLGEKAAHPELLRNFARVKSGNQSKSEPKQSPTPWNSDEPPPLITKPTPTPEISVAEQAKTKVELLDVTSDVDGVLTIKLLTPDPDLPKLLANPVFSPVFGDGSEFTAAEPENAIISNGAFRLSLISKDTVVLDKSQTYRNSAAIDIDTIRFVPTETAEDALEAYRTGRVDAVSNAEFEPVALKLLAPFQDFRKVTHGALNLYEFNTAKAPFSDRDVREALAISIERERLTEGEMEGSTRPALRLLPVGGKPVKELIQDVAHAKELLEGAGFPDGVGFPVIRLVVNRNDAQQRIAKAVAKMWKQNLGIETEIIVKEINEIAAVRQQGEYDIIRRGVVFPSSDAVSNMSAIFGPADGRPERSLQDFLPLTNSNSSARADKKPEAKDTSQSAAVIPSEAEALYDLKAIPLYFPASYSLVKPYVQGFEPNGLDVLSLKDIRIDYNWQPKRPSNES
jgi:oligopeptide transport system substrate-binding protein